MRHSVTAYNRPFPVPSPKWNAAIINIINYIFAFPDFFGCNVAGNQNAFMKAVSKAGFI